ncbi:hypothetical protein MPTK1_6g11110 [Marchantia polymorpha subsp. ruderalis]|uniref:Uncharacterized protein n=2 Tax=Marchantia polymorpha TaxID=3197 RepID=A0AAF6BQT7_MARPO|nr:hypothetical protein MARPO_0016s0150 [Marchantia polymorpha]BBN14371.1 hypothetical protein Mp_6g11110 [Marchantia polymorpha subsp. ruderalis]|eukprot:PTQ45104.1 hypothetical protein MARPO_0016s0150 [Marchantia polymorpha]
MEGGRARATSPGEQERLGRRHTLRGFLPGAEEHEKIEAERSLGPGIHFYPSTSVAKIGDFKDEEDCIQEANRFQPSGLDPTVIFKKVDENDAKLAPEQNITLFALRLAMIEKAASGIGTLSFIWASTIILGGFASNINPSDFLVVTIILITEGTRIFTRSRELEWQHVTSKSTDTLKFHKPDKPDKPDRRTLSRQDRLPKDDVRWQDGLPARERAAAAAAANAVALPHPDVAPPTPRREGSTASETAPSSGYCLPAISVCVEKPGEKRTVAPLEREADEDEAFPKAPKGASPENPEREKIQRLRLGSLSAKSIKRTWTAQVVPMIPCGFHSILTTRGVSSLLYWTQLASALICLILSGWRMASQDFNPEGTPPDETPVNLFWSVNIFYALALTEAALFLLERAYWEWKISVQKLLVDVNDRCDLGEDNRELTKQFFYEVYKKCVEGSVFDGLDMDLVEYSLTLLKSDNTYEQLGGARVLRKIVDRYDGFAADALRRIGTTSGIIERLVEMLSWRGPNQEEMRKEVAGLICRVARYSKNCFRIAAVPGSMEGIVALLKCPGESGDGAGASQTLALRLDGLRILVALTRDSVNLLKIGETRGLVPILVSFMAVRDRLRFKKMDGIELKIFKKVMRLLALLAAARNVSGNILRTVVARVVSSIANLRDILEDGDSHPQLQWMAIEILTNLALDDSIRRAIGSTGGVIRILFHIHTRHLNYMRSGEVFASEEQLRVEMAVSKRAGDALNLLAIQNSKNSLRMLDLKDSTGGRPFIPALIELLNEHREHTICAAKILRSLMEYGSEAEKREIAVCSRRIMKLVMESRSHKMQEAVVGLAPRVVAVLDDEAYDEIFSAIDRPRLVQQLLANLEHNCQASSKFPRIRRHSIEFIVVLVKRDTYFLEKFRENRVEHKLEQSMETISEVENFVLFSGAEGLTRHSITMEDLIQRSLSQIKRQNQQQGHHESFHLNTAQRP